MNKIASARKVDCGPDRLAPESAPNLAVDHRDIISSNWRRSLYRPERGAGRSKGGGHMSRTRMILLAAVLAGGSALFASSGVSAAPINGSMIGDAATLADPLVLKIH